MFLCLRKFIIRRTSVKESEHRVKESMEKRIKALETKVSGDVKVLKERMEASEGKASEKIEALERKMSQDIHALVGQIEHSNANTANQIERVLTLLQSKADA